MSQDFFYPPGSSNSIVVPPGLATAANQTVQIGLETSIDNKTPTLGQKTMANSSPVVIASDQSAIHVIVDSGLANPLPVTDAAAEASLASIDTKLTSPLAVMGPLTDVELRASAVDVLGPLTDTELRAAPVPVSGTISTGGLTDAELRASPVPVSGPLTDTQLRASPVPVSGTVSTGGLTDTQLRASAVPVIANAGTNLNTSALSLESTQSAFSAKSMSAFINVPFDEVVITYIAATTRIDTVQYLLSAVLQNTLTLSYDGSDRLNGVVKT